jgi:FMN phosphatase YigB (HAD superfamily)
VYVGDHPFFDVEAARAVGMVPVLIDRRGRHPDVDAIRITSLEDLPEAIGVGT